MTNIASTTIPAPVPAAIPAGVPTVMVAVVAGLLLGPATLWLIRVNLRRPRPPRPRDAAAVIALVGLLAAFALEQDRGYGLLPLIVFGIAASAVDLAERRLPDPLTCSLMGATTIVVMTECVITGDTDAAVRAAAAAACVYAGALLAKVVQSSAIGWGDVKLVLSLAATLGWWNEKAVFTGVFMWGTFIMVAALIVGLKDRRRDVPYGPALLLGTLGAVAVVT